MSSFRERLATLNERRSSLLCVGIDPSPETIALLSPTRIDSTVAYASAAERIAGHIIDSARDHAVAAKFQLAWFELAGVAGMSSLERLTRYARRAGLLVILDGKRGDVPHSATAYARAYLGATSAESGICGDALTVNAAIGADALAAMASVAHERDAELFALAHTSNPGATELQDAKLADGSAWWHRMCGIIDTAGCGAVVGATYPTALAEARTLMPQAPILVPGIGAQGGAIGDLAPVIVSGAPLPLVAASRSLLPDQAIDLPAFKEHVRASCEQLAAETWRLVI